MTGDVPARYRAYRGDGWVGRGTLGRYGFHNGAMTKHSPHTVFRTVSPEAGPSTAGRRRGPPAAQLAMFSSGRLAQPSGIGNRQAAPAERMAAAPFPPRRSQGSTAVGRMCSYAAGFSDLWYGLRASG